MAQHELPIEATHPLQPAPRSLRACLAQEPRCQKLFDQAERLTKSLFDFSKGSRKPLPFFTDHTIQHFIRVEAMADAILYANERGDRPFEPSPEEAMYLLSAIWLHDIGMLYGIFPSETSTGDDIPWSRIRANHEHRAAKFIQNNWEQECDWSRFQKIYLAQLCIFHRRSYSLATMDPPIAKGECCLGKPIRLQQLGALLRLSDACHVDESRVPLDMRNHFESFGMPSESVDHWGIPLFIQAVEFNHREKLVQPTFYIPPTKLIGTVTVDFRIAVEAVVSSLTEELHSVAPYLAAYSNTDFKAVSADIHDPAALADQELYMMKMWPTMLALSGSASEAASMVAAVIMASASRSTGALPKEELQQITEKAIALHPYNLLVRQLVKEVNRAVESNAQPQHIIRCKELYLKRRQEAPLLVAQQAKSHIQPNDVIVVYGYSHNVMTLLTDILFGQQNKVVVVRSSHPPIKSVYARDEDERVLADLRKTTLCTKVVDMASIPGVFSYFQQKNLSVKVLISAYGIFNGGDVLAKVGSSLLALAAHAVGGSVLVLAEPEKRVTDSDVKAEMERLLLDQAGQLIAKKASDRPAELVPQIDRLTKGMYTPVFDWEKAGVESAPVIETTVGNDQ